MDKYQKLMIGNGLLVMFVSMMAGFMLMFGLIGGVEVWPGVIIEFSVYGTTDGWVRAHSGGVTNGLMVILIALVLPRLELSDKVNAFFAWGLVYTAWSFTLFYWVGNAAANRSLTIGDSRLGEADWLSLIGALPAVPSVFLAPIILFWGGYAALKLMNKGSSS